MILRTIRGCGLGVVFQQPARVVGSKRTNCRFVSRAGPVVSQLLAHPSRALRPSSKSLVVESARGVNLTEQSGVSAFYNVRHWFARITDPRVVGKYGHLKFAAATKHLWQGSDHCRK